MKIARPHRSNRNSSIELLRIISIVMVLFVHYIPRIQSSLETNTFKYYFSELISAFVIIGVNCFVLISGYFGIESK